MIRRSRFCLLLAAFAAAVPSVVRGVPCLSGFVRDANGVPVENGDLDFIHVATGVKLFTPGDNTDEFGFYNVCVLPGIYHVAYAPPPGTRLMGRQVFDVDLRSDPGQELNVVLEFGTVVSGTVRGSHGAPIGAVDVDVDRLSGGRVYTPDDNSDLITGNYRIVIPNGDYRIRFEPPLGERWLGLQLDSVTVAGDAVLDVSLTEGMLLEGRVTDPQGNGLPEIDVELRDPATGAKIFVANNTTDLSGGYVVAVPAGVFELRFSPRRGSRFVGTRLDGFEVAGDQQWDQVLQPGVILTAGVEDTLGAPVAGVDLDLRLESTGEKVFTPNDKTDLEGISVVSVMPGVYTIELTPPVGAAFDRVTVPGVAILRDTTVVLEMQQVTRVSVTGRVTDPSGIGVQNVKIDAHLQSSGRRVFIPAPFTDALGFFDLSIPVGLYDVFLVPLRGSRLVGRKIESVNVEQSNTWGTLELQSGWLFTARVSDDTGAQVENVDLDFIVESTGMELFTPHDNTDAQGMARVVVPPGRYTVELTPPPGSRLSPAALRGVDVAGDTTAAYTLSRSSGSPSVKGFSLWQNNPNPFVHQTIIAYDIHAPTDVSVRIYDVSGRLVRVVHEGFQRVDSFRRTWDGTDRSGRRVTTGVYFVRLTTPRGSATRKILFVR